MESAVTFANDRRVHVGITVDNLETALPFYQELFGAVPSKRRPDYAKFELAEPPVNFTLNEQPGFVPVFGGADHFGIQVKSQSAVRAAVERLGRAGIATVTEEGVVCCYAEQDKVWVTDPDGRKWEIFVVLDADREEHHVPASKPDSSEERAPCPPQCCT